MSDSDPSIEGELPLVKRPLMPKKGRGAVSNLRGRHELLMREDFDDGWSNGVRAAGDIPPDTDAPNGGESEDAQTWKTQIIEERAKTILSRNQSPDVPFTVSLNPYRGCEHGCIYCFARPTHSYLGLSPGLDFESKIFAKVNAADLLRSELAKNSYVPEPIALGVNTDAYQPCERDLRLTRRVLEVLRECQHPVALISKSSLIERDIDLLADMASKRLAVAAVTITTLDPAIARTLEPRAAAPARRLRTIRTLTEAGIPVGISIAPVIPFVTEPDLERILGAAAEAGAINAGYVMLRLPWEVSPLFQQWLEAHFPDRAARVMNRVRDLRGGKDYDSSFGKRMHGEGIWANLIRQRFDKTVARLGLTLHSRRFNGLDSSRFRAPGINPSVNPSAASAAVPLQSAGKTKNKKAKDSDGQFELF